MNFMVNKEIVKKFLKPDCKKILICFLIVCIAISLFPSIFLTQIYCIWCPCTMMLPYPEGCPKIYFPSALSIILIIFSYLFSSFIVYFMVEKKH